MMYSHDGFKDSLTNLAAPPFFYEELRRGLSRVVRNDGQLSLIRLVLSAHTESNSLDAMTSPDDLEILQLAEILAHSSRGEDLCARLGECEFVVLLYASESIAEQYIERISSRWHESLASKKNNGISVSMSHVSFCISADSNQSVLEFLKKLDREPLINPTSHESGARDRAHDRRGEHAIASTPSLSIPLSRKPR